MKTKIEIKNIWGSVIFKYKKENNSTSKTLTEYIKRELKSGKRVVDLSYADLRGTNLSFMDLSRVNLCYADLTGAILSNANLSHARLTSANLSYTTLNNTNLYYTDLSYANLGYANLSYTNLSYVTLSHVKNLVYASCYFSGFNGGSQLLAVKIGEDIRLFCEYFMGDKIMMREHIEKGTPELKNSRLIALGTILQLVENR